MNTETSISNIKRTGIFIVLIVGMFVSAMATTVTANMIPNFTEYFNVSENLAQWLTSGATLISGIVIPITAFLIKRLPNKVYFFIAMTAYTLGSLLVSISQNFPMLLVCRLIQALGCGMMIPFVQVILLNIYPTEKHGRVMSFYSMASMISSVVGPTYAGLILDSVGWRGVFISLFVFGVIILVFGGIFMKNIIPRSTATLNMGFVSLSALGFVSLIIGVSNMSDGILLHLKSGGLIVLGIILLVVFSWFQLKSKSPMLNLTVFKNSSFRIAIVISICYYLIAMGSGMILPILTKTLCGYSNASYGYATLVGAILAVITTFYAGRIYDKAGIKPMFIMGVILFAVYTVLGYFSTERASIMYIAVIYAIQNIAMSLLNSPTTTLALSGFSGNLRIDGSAVLNTIRQISSSLASTLAIMIYTLSGNGIGAIRIVFIYYGIVTVVIAISMILYLREKKKAQIA